MATIVLSSVGMAIGGSIGGTVLGLSMAAAGRFVGATVGRVIDQRLMGAGSETVETGRVDRFRLMGASEGSAIGQAFGRIRLPGQIIWASPFTEKVSRSGGGGKGSSSQPKTKSYSYSVSLAIAICEGEISRIGRIWADGLEIAPNDLNMRVYPGSDDQLPDPKIEAVEGTGQAPAYRGTAYVVLEDLALEQFNNRVPQFSFEVFKPGRAGNDQIPEVAEAVRAVALIPGTGEYALATTPVYYEGEVGKNGPANVNSPSGLADFPTSVDNFTEELPNCGSALIVTSWFGSDLRCGECEIKPKVENSAVDGRKMPWTVAGIGRSEAEEIAKVDGRPVYGGTPTDQSLIEAIEHLREKGQAQVFYPFILMEQLEGNDLIDPYTGDAGQPALPWRGRITTDLAPLVAGTSDGTAAADMQVAEFFGQAQVDDFVFANGRMVYSGPDEWSYRRFILHYAHVCAAAGGVSAFCIGSEMRGLTQIRGASSFPAVDQMRQLAGDVRAILGPDVKIGYAADWSEYFGYHPQDGSADVYFHLDPLWADDAIDFIGIDNYMPMSDWRDGDSHADASWGSIYNLAYLQTNIEGGEGYDWFYHSPEAEAAQIRTPIEDGAYGEPWVFRYKDLRNWWSNSHHNRIGGVRQAEATDWVPMSKPFWFTEYGCAAIDKGTNQPNKFLDPKSSESFLPKYSTGARDELIQSQYLRAFADYWNRAENNPVSLEYDGRMIDMDRAHVWAWDTRPFPFFPNDVALWSDGENYARGHWLNGRSTYRSLSAVVREISAASGVEAVETDKLFGLVRGYAVEDVTTGRSALQPLMLAHGFDAIERDGRLIFQNRTGKPLADLTRDDLAENDEQDADVSITRAPSAEVAGRVRLNFFEAQADYEVRGVEAVFPDEVTRSVSQNEYPMVLGFGEAQGMVERWLSEARVARDVVRFALPPSASKLGAGDVVSFTLGDASGTYRLDRVEEAGVKLVEAVRVESNIYTPRDEIEGRRAVRPFVRPVPVLSAFLDLPLMTGEEIPHAPHLAVTARPWPGSVAVYSSSTESDYTLNRLMEGPAAMGETRTVFPPYQPGVIDRQTRLRVRLFDGVLNSIQEQAFLAGQNLAAVGDGTTDRWRLFQFQTADLIEAGVYELSDLLHGQLGTDAFSQDALEPGASFVLIDPAVQQIELSAGLRDIVQYYRIGPGLRQLDDPSYEERVEAFKGVGLRPYSPCHVSSTRQSNGALVFRWIRRTRIDGDSWAGLDVPLGEDSELYLVRVLIDGSIVREVNVTTPEWTYDAAQQAADGAGGDCEVAVAQVSARFGPGPFASHAFVI